MSLSRQTLAIALLASLALNLLILGTLAGAAFAGWRHGPPDHWRPAPVRMAANLRFSPQRFMHNLPETQRRKAVRAARQATMAHRKLFREIRQTRLEIIRLLTADHWDEEAIEKAFARQRLLDNEQQQFAQKLMLDILRDLDPQTRRRVLQAASMHRQGTPHRRHLPPPPQ